MEIALLEPTVRWRPLARKSNHHRHQQQHDDTPDDLPSAEHVSCFVTLESDVQEQRHLPCTLSLPSSDAKEYPAFLAQVVTFHVFSKEDSVVGEGGELLLLSKHSRPLRECVPVLTEAKVSWSDVVTWKQTGLELDVNIPVVTNREPRLLVEHLIHYKSRAHALAEQLSLHRNVVAVGLLPPVLGCFIGVIATSPVWVPLTLFVAILGFPLWFVVAIGLSLVIVFSTISALIAVQVMRSKRLKQELERFLQGPHGQLLLFKGASPDEGKLKQFVMSDPKHKLLASLLIDFLGNATFVLPGIGELADLLWAPLSASMISGMYSETSPNIKYFAFMEEVLPFTDFIPTATLGWMKENATVDQVRELLASLRMQR
jgi:hypothetical protein